MKTVIDPQQVNDVLKELEIENLDNATIRQICTAVHKLEIATEKEFIHFEIGVPGLKASQVGIDAEKAALDRGVACVYPSIEGISELKREASRFVKAFIGTDIAPEGCIPTVGSMQGAFASLMVCARLDAKKDTILYVDPGFSIQKLQAEVIGIKTASFDLFHYRAEKLEDKLESYLKEGNIAAIIYSNPNNPTWMCLSDDELRTIGTLATKYDTIIIEDLAYITMDFRKELGTPYMPPYQVSVSNYTDNYIILMSASKIFSYAGQRIAVTCISDKLFNRKYSSLSDAYGISTLGGVFVHRFIYTLTSGVSYSAQCALAEMFRAACDGEYDFVKDVSEYAERSARLKKILLKNNFNIVYDRDIEEPLSDGFFFTVRYKDMSGAELLKELLSFGVSGVALKSTGAELQGIRACSSAIKPHHYDLLDERLQMFNQKHNK